MLQTGETDCLKAACSGLYESSKALEGTDSSQVCAKIYPAPISPAPSGYRVSSYKGWIVPETLTVCQPNISVAEQASSYGAGINGEGEMPPC